MTIASTAESAIHARAGRIAHLTYSAGAVGLGVLCLIAGDLAYVFQPLPRWMPWHAGLAYLSGAVLVAGGGALLARRTMRLAALALAINFSVWLLLCNLPAALSKPRVVGYWEGCGLNMTVIAGAWILVALSGSSLAGGRLLFGDNGVKLARRVFAVGIPLIGLAHFVNAHEATAYVPSWFPLPIGWVYATGAAHVAAGLALLFGVVPRLAATLEAAQITAFVLIAHIPAVCRSPADRLEWAQLVYAVAIAGAAWLVAVTTAPAPVRRRGY
jgi:uncharacterized membrane protein